MLWPVLLGGLRAEEAASLAATHAWQGAHAFTLWLPGWLGGLAAGVLLLHAAACGPSPWRGGGAPFILRPAMRWVLALTLLLTSSLHQWSLAHSSGIDLTPADALAPLALLVLILNELSARAAPRDREHDQLVMLGLAVCGVLLFLLTAGLAPPEDADLPNWARRVTAEALAPAPLLALIAGAGIALGWRRGSHGLVWGAAWPLFAAILTWHAGAGIAELNWLAGVAYVALLLGGWACWRRHTPAGLWALALVHSVVVQLPPVHAALVRAQLMPALVLLTLYASSLLLIVIVAPGLLGARLRRFAAWGFLGGVAHCCGFHAANALQLLSGLAAAGVLAAAGWRARDWVVALPLMIPSCVVVLRWGPENRAWLAVWAAFALLGATLALGRHRLKTRIGQP